MAPVLSSPLSFRTALTTPSSQNSRDSQKDVIENSKSDICRPAKVLPYELQEHCLVYLEEQLYSSALSLFNNLLTAGTSYPDPASHPAFVPPPSHIALISTLLVHPFHTTRAPSLERHEVSSRSLILLRNLLTTLGPLNANLGNAFTFEHSKYAVRRSRRGERKTDYDDGKNSPNRDEAIGSVFAKKGSLWMRAEDFWQVVGWAFNCSINHRKRWEYWKVWLEFMLDVLNADWKERSLLEDDLEEQSRQRTGSTPPLTMLPESLLARYVSEGVGSSKALKRIVKAIFADGSVEAVRAYPEIFDRETLESREQRDLKRKREVKLDVEQDIYGDYIEDDVEGEDPSLDSSQPVQSSPADSSQSETSNAPQSGVMGGPEAIVLRLRLLALLSLVSSSSPNTLVPIRDLYDVFFEVIQPLPLPAFALFMTPTAVPHLPTAALSSLCQVHLSVILPPSVPHCRTDELTQDSLERCFLPFAANTSSIEDNAKVSLLVETLFRLFATTCDIDVTPELVDAVEKGVLARENKVTGNKRRKLGSTADQDALWWLRSSAERIGLLLEAVQVRHAVAQSLA